MALGAKEEMRFIFRERESLGPCRVGEPCPAPLRVAMRSPLPFPCVPDRPYKILLVQVGTLSVLLPPPVWRARFIYLYIYIYIEREREMEGLGGRAGGAVW